MIKDVQDTNADFGLQSITQTRLHNVARAYGWWISKDSVSLLILKVCVKFYEYISTHSIPSTSPWILPGSKLAHVNF